LQILISVIWILIFAGIVAGLSIEQSAAIFKAATKACPYGMGAAKFALLGTMGELLGARIASGKWTIRGIRLWQRALVWGVLGALMAAVFPLFSFGVDGLLEAGLLPGNGTPILHAVWKSIFLNMLFGFEMMCFHRLTDTLISQNKLFTIWPVVETYKSINWQNMFRVVGLALFWFWIPAQTVTFMLSPEHRITMAALLGVALGIILGFAARRAKQ
jgi:uncharacterized membrane protein YsdA (DUF1294 family)